MHCEHFYRGDLRKKKERTELETTQSTLSQQLQQKKGSAHNLIPNLKAIFWLKKVIRRNYVKVAMTSISNLVNLQLIKLIIALLMADKIVIFDSNNNY